MINNDSLRQELDKKLNGIKNEFIEKCITLSEKISDRELEINKKLSELDEIKKHNSIVQKENEDKLNLKLASLEKERERFISLQKEVDTALKGYVEKQSQANKLLEKINQDSGLIQTEKNMAIEANIKAKILLTEYNDKLKSLKIDSDIIKNEKVKLEDDRVKLDNKIKVIEKKELELSEKEKDLSTERNKVIIKEKELRRIELDLKARGK